MKCFRAKLSDRREVPVSVTSRRGSPRHYCQRRLANSSLDEQEWLKRYTPERFHLESLSQDLEENISRSETPSSSGGESEIFKISTTKSVFRPAFLTITNLDFPQDASTAEAKTWSKKRARYKTVPKNCSSHLHRMFVKSELAGDEISRASSRASTDYDGYEFEEYLREFNLPDDSSECSLFGSGEEEDTARKHPYSNAESSNNNDSEFINKNDYDYMPEVSKVCETSTAANSNVTTYMSSKDPKMIDCQSASSSIAIVSHKREKRKSLTLSRIPSPETVQVIRVDVITGYPVSSDNSLLSEITDSERPNSEDSSIVHIVKPLIYHKEIHLHSHGTQTECTGGALDDMSNSTRYYVECERLLNCRSVNLSDRTYNNNK